MSKTILVIGTFDTKEDELGYLIGRIKAQGGAVLAMDVSVLGDTAHPVDVTKHEVVAAAGERSERSNAGDVVLARRLPAVARHRGHARRGLRPRWLRLVS